MTLDKVEVTQRGFEIIKFKDRYGARCSLQQSSLADTNPPGSSAVWLGADGERMHLDKDRVEKLVARLQNWLDACSFEDQPK